MTRIATWNVNGIRARLPQLTAWLQHTRPEFVALQETKVQDTDFPHAAIRDAGYGCLINGQPRYNGTATLWRSDQPSHTLIGTNLPGMDDGACRLLMSASPTLRLVNVYVPNGQTVDSEAYGYKLDWLRQLRATLASLLSADPETPLVVLGDFNVAPADIDVHDPAAWAGKILCSTPERTALAELCGLGLCDLFRALNPQTPGFSWWDYRFGGFARDRGLRIDLLLGNAAARERAWACEVDRGPRGLEKPSDHAPVVLTLD